MKEICIIETEKHHEVIRNFVCSVQNSFCFTIVSNTLCIDALSFLEIKNVTFLNYETSPEDVNKLQLNAKFFLKITITPPLLKDYNSFEPLFLDSVLFLHNFNFWLRPYQNIYALKQVDSNSLISGLRFIKYLFNSHVIRSTYLRTFKSYLALSKEQYEHFKHYPRLKSYVELAYTNIHQKSQKRDSLKIVIPGTAKKRRLYLQIIKSLKSINETLSKRIELEILGENKTGVDFRKYISENFRIIEHANYVKEDIYLSKLKTAHLILLILEEHVDFKGILEFTGKTKISGRLNDAFFVGGPVLVPEFYPINVKSPRVYKFNNVSSLKEAISHVASLSEDKDQKTFFQERNRHAQTWNENLILGLGENETI